MEPERLQQMAQPLLDWYDKNARVLPWRSQPTPYRVLVSEIMLQQTRVDAVKPYFARFMEALPDLESLAAAPEQTLATTTGCEICKKPLKWWCGTMAACCPGTRRN